MRADMNSGFPFNNGRTVYLVIFGPVWTDLTQLPKHDSNGRGDRIRTYDPLVPNQMRYQTALHPDIFTNALNCSLIRAVELRYSVQRRKIKFHK